MMYNEKSSRLMIHQLSGSVSAFPSDESAKFETMNPREIHPLREALWESIKLRSEVCTHFNCTNVFSVLVGMSIKKDTHCCNSIGALQRTLVQPLYVQICKAKSVRA